jgi:N-dimethylarginine dimethylaminohydrolase
MKITCHSEFGELLSVYLKRPHEAMVNNERIGRTWKELNFISPPVFEQAVAEYATFESLLRTSSVEIKYFPQDERVTMDSMYCRDASLATDFGVILCNMGKLARKPEPAACRNAFNGEEMQILGAIDGTGTLEGGDVAWLGTHTLAVGHTYRTNIEGIRQLKSLLEPRGVEILTAALPHYKGEADVFHLMSIISPVDRNLAVVYSPLMPIAFRQLLLARGFELVEVPDEEFETMGCNVLAIGPRKVVMVAGNPITRSRLIQAGCTVYEYDGADISMKGGGGPTCLTRPLKRLVTD